MQKRIALDQSLALLDSASEREELSPVHSVDCLVVELDGWERLVSERALLALAAPPPPPCPVIGLLPGAASRDLLQVSLPPFIDLVAESDEQLTLLEQRIQRQPHSAAILMQLLRLSESVSVNEGLFAESLAYSTLQHGAAFKSWLAARGTQRSEKEETGPLVLIDREEDRLTIRLNRPEKRNAYSAAMRDELHQALMLVAYDDSITQARISGVGAGFCAGGDLTEFGEARDASAAHLARMTSSTGALLHQLRDRVTFRLHGACVGAGIELPAFSSRITASSDAFFQLPEVAFGLIPGAGGTVSVARRIGRLRAGYLAISDERIDAPTALAWGLIDAIE